MGPMLNLNFFLEISVCVLHKRKLQLHRFSTLLAALALGIRSFVKCCRPFDCACEKLGFNKDGETLQARSDLERYAEEDKFKLRCCLDSALPGRGTCSDIMPGLLN